MTKGTIKTQSSTPVDNNKTGAVAIEKKQKAKNGSSYIPNGVGKGGKREDSGREEKKAIIKALGISDMINQHIIEEVDVVEVNVNTKARTATKKPAVRAILDMLRYKALKHYDVKAAKEYFDRTLGRAKQHIEFEDVVPEEEQRLPTKAEKAAARAYLAALEDDEE